MKKIIGFLKEYYNGLDKRVFACCTLFIACLIYLNYKQGLTKSFSKTSFWTAMAGWYLLFLVTFAFGYVLIASFKKASLFKNRTFITLLFLAPVIFAWKMIYRVHFNFSSDTLLNAYWNSVAYYPFKLLVISAILFAIWKVTRNPDEFYGLHTSNFNMRPYLMMLLIMIPVVGLAATQPDFLNQYPRMKSIGFLKGADTGWYKLLYELSYGSDFLTIELFFRGFLILAFMKYAGREAILPMAMFYCTIHFGKPLGECISSYFGGMILGIVIYHSRTILGGLIVHLGIAWLMELGGYLGNHYLK